MLTRKLIDLYRERRAWQLQSSIRLMQGWNHAVAVPNLPQSHLQLSVMLAFCLRTLHDQYFFKSYFVKPLRQRG